MLPKPCRPLILIFMKAVLGLHRYGSPLPALSLAVGMVLTFWISAIEAQSPASSTLETCFRVGKRVNGKLIGPTTCRITQETRFVNVQGVPYRRIEIGISGTIDGYTVKTGPRLDAFTDSPALALGQRGNLGPYFHGVGVYHSEKGSGITLFIPESSENWNSKLFVTVHGGTRPYQTVGELVPREPDQHNPLTGANHYAGLMIDKGYAVVHTRRLVTSSRLADAGKHGEPVTLDDGSVLEGKSYGYHAGMIRDWALVAENFLNTQLSRLPTRTYFYGLSSGAALGRLLNYNPAANLDSEGRKVIDGMLLNDGGGGWFSPIVSGVFEGLPSLYAAPSTEGDGFFVLRPDDEDHLTFDISHRERFAHQIEIGHRGYRDGHFIAGSYLDDRQMETYLSLKGENHRLLVSKGLAAKTRTYEVVGVGHFDAGYLRSSKELSSQSLDLGGIFDALIDVLDLWVDQGIEPPPTRSDLLNQGDSDPGRKEISGIQLPEIACPQGVFYEFPRGTDRVGVTGFATYLQGPPAPSQGNSLNREEERLEPMDRRGYPVDMNHNGIRDRRETLTEAWRRRHTEGEKYGTLADNEVFTDARFTSCVRGVAEKLFEQRLLSRHAMLDYIQRAEKADRLSP